MSALRRHWAVAVADAGSPSQPERVAAQGDALIDRWREPHRHYHDLTHLAAVLGALDVLSAPDVPPAPVRLAAWFHDAVYDGVPGADERASGALAREVTTGLGLAQDVVAEVVRLILLTAEHRVGPGDAHGGLLADADLAILAAPPADYARYASSVRTEYAHVAEADFVAGRRAVLHRLLERPSLYVTAAARSRWEAAARDNLRAELDRLASAH